MIDALDKLLNFFQRLESALPWLGYLGVSVVGGVAAYIKEYEDKNPTRTFAQHLWAMARRLIFALVAGGMWYQIVLWQSLRGSPLSYLGATLVGLYATEFMDFIWTQFKSRISAAPPPASKP